MYVCWGKYFISSRMTKKKKKKKMAYSFWHKEFDIVDTGLQIRCYVFALKDLQQITANIV